MVIPAGTVQPQLFTVDVKPLIGQDQASAFISARTYAVVATFVLLSPAACRVAAVPVVFAALFGMSPDTSAGNCACGKVPVVKSLALTVTLLESACPLTVVLVGTLFPKSVVRLVTCDSAMLADSPAALPDVLACKLPVELRSGTHTNVQFALSGLVSVQLVPGYIAAVCPLPLIVEVVVVRLTFAVPVFRITAV